MIATNNFCDTCQEVLELIDKLLGNDIGGLVSMFLLEKFMYERFDYGTLRIVRMYEIMFEECWCSMTWVDPNSIE